MLKLYSEYLHFGSICYLYMNLRSILNTALNPSQMIRIDCPAIHMVDDSEHNIVVCTASCK